MKPLYSDSEWPEHFAAYDIEALEWVNVILVCHVDEYGNKLAFKTIDAYLDWVFSPSFKGDTLFAHFGGHYDHRFLMAKAKDRGWDFRTAISGNSIVILTITDSKGRAIKFGDSYRLLPDSLANIGKTVGLAKLDVDASALENQTEQEILEYCMRDCEIVLKGLQLMRSVMKSVNADYAFTLASIASRYNRRNCGIDWDKFVVRRGRKMVPHPNIKLWDGECYFAYYGGRTEMFKKGIHNKPIYWYDIVSSYPTSMMEDLPLYYMGWFLKPERESMDSYISHCGITECVVRIPEDTPFPILPWKDKDGGRLTFPVGILPPPGSDAPGRWTNIELQEAVKQGATILQVTGQWRFKAEPWLRGFVKTFYRLRQDAKDKGDEFGSYAYKILLNSSYGKLVETIQRRSYMTTGEVPAIIERLTQDGHSPEAIAKMVSTTPTQGVFCTNTEEVGPFRHTAAGAYVTAYSRLRLARKAIEMIKQGAEVYYCDTDSLMIDKPFFETGKALGDWEHVATLKELELVLPKVYRAIPEWHEKGKMETIYKCKGCPIKRKFEDPSMAQRRWDAFKNFRFETTQENMELLAKDGVTGFLSDIKHGSIHPRRLQASCKFCKASGLVEGLACPKCQGVGTVHKPLVRALRSDDKKRVWSGQNSTPIVHREVRP